jgi:hypothetical protein
MGLKRTSPFVVGFMMLQAGMASAQYYQLKSADGQHQVLKASGRDSVIVDRLTPFDLPAVSDSVELMYHEPMPDSIMPASAIVLGQIRIQMVDREDIIPLLEKYARKSGADWIVSFSEPKGYRTRNGDTYWRASATLMKVLDPTFIEQDKLKYCYYEDQHLQNYAALQLYMEKHTQMGARVDRPQDATDSQTDSEGTDNDSSDH